MFTPSLASIVGFSLYLGEVGWLGHVVTLISDISHCTDWLTCFMLVMRWKVRITCKIRQLLMKA